MTLASALVAGCADDFIAGGSGKPEVERDASFYKPTQLVPVTDAYVNDCSVGDQRVIERECEDNGIKFQDCEKYYLDDKINEPITNWGFDGVKGDMSPCYDREFNSDSGSVVDWGGGKVDAGENSSEEFNQNDSSDLYVKDLEPRDAIHDYGIINLDDVSNMPAEIPDAGLLNIVYDAIAVDGEIGSDSTDLSSIDCNVDANYIQDAGLIDSVYDAITRDSGTGDNSINMDCIDSEIIDECIGNARSIEGRIAFTSFRSAGGESPEITIMNLDGSERVNLTDVGINHYPSWSPDGTKIAFQRNINGDYEIYVMRADGSNQINLTNSPGYDMIPNWSPDGTKIVFTSYRNGRENAEIYIMNADGSEQVNLTNAPRGDYGPDWSPDGTKIAFVSTRDEGDLEIYVMNVDGSNQINLTNSLGFDHFPSWSPDETKIAFTSQRGGDLEVYIMNADGSNQVNLTNSPGHDSDPDWSPDGTKIAFTSYRDGNFEVYIMNADGSNQVNLTNTPEPMYEMDPSWSP